MASPARLNLSTSPEARKRSWRSLAGKCFKVNCAEQLMAHALARVGQGAPEVDVELSRELLDAATPAVIFVAL